MPVWHPKINLVKCRVTELLFVLFTFYCSLHNKQTKSYRLINLNETLGNIYTSEEERAELNLVVANIVVQEILPSVNSKTHTQN